MGKVKRNDEPCSGRSNERPIKKSQTRSKRAQRTDLDELHRNVLETKRNLRLRAPHQQKRSKTSFTKVLTEFADRRGENEVEDDKAMGVKRGGRTKPRITCDRLLPETMVGIFKNGSKGREIHRGTIGERLNEKNVARLRDDVMKLLDGDETNLDSSSKGRETIETRRVRRTKSTARQRDKKKESNFETETGRRIVKDVSSDTSTGSSISTTSTNFTTSNSSSPIAKKKMVGRERERKNDENNKIAKPKDQRTKVIRQKEEGKHKRRLFEPDDEGETVKNSFGIIDRPGLMEEIRFSSNRKINTVAPSDVGELKMAKNNIAKSIEKQAETSIEMATDHICGLPPIFCYENFCAEMCINHFENKNHRYKVPDRTAIIQKSLTEFYLENRRKMLERHKLGDEKKNGTTIVPLKESCIEKSVEMDQDSPDDSMIKVGSWHPDTRTNIENTIEDDTPIDTMSIKTPPRIDTAQKTINSVALFLKKFEQNILLKPTEKKVPVIFPKTLEIRDDKDKKLNDNLNVPFSDLMTSDLKNVRRKNTKHIPTILRRSNNCPGRVEKFDKKSWLFPHDSGQTNGPKVEKKLPSNHGIPLRPSLPENHTIKETSFSPVSTVTLSPVSSTTTIQYSDHQQSRREINQNILDNEIRKMPRTKLKLNEGNNRSNGSFVVDGDVESKTSGTTGYQADVSDNIRGSIEESAPGPFVNGAKNMGNYTTKIKCHSVNNDRTEIENNRMNFFANHSEETNGQNDKNCLNESDRFLNEINCLKTNPNQHQQINNNFQEPSISRVQRSLEFHYTKPPANYRSYSVKIDERNGKYSSQYENTKNSLVRDDNLDKSSRIAMNNWQKSNSHPTNKSYLKNYSSRENRMEMTDERCIETRNLEISNQSIHNERSINSLHNFLSNKDSSRINAHFESECIFLGCEPIDSNRGINQLPKMPNFESYDKFILLRDEIAKYKSMGFSYKDGQEYSLRLNGFHYIYFPHVQVKLSNHSLSRTDWKSGKNKKIDHERETFEDSQPKKFLAFKQSTKSKNPPMRIPVYENIEPISVDSIGADGKILTSRIVNEESRENDNEILQMRGRGLEHQMGKNVREQKGNNCRNEQIGDDRRYEYPSTSNFYDNIAPFFLHYADSTDTNEHRRVPNHQINFHQTFNENNVPSSSQTTSHIFADNAPKNIYTDNSQGMTNHVEESRQMMNLTESSREPSKIGPSRVYRSHYKNYTNETSARREGTGMTENLPKFIQLPDGRVGFY